jgi:hypothetical protein
VKSVRNMNNVHTFYLWKDAELSAGKISEEKKTVI